MSRNSVVVQFDLTVVGQLESDRFPDAGGSPSFPTHDCPISNRAFSRLGGLRLLLDPMLFRSEESGLRVALGESRARLFLGDVITSAHPGLTYQPNNLFQAPNVVRDASRLRYHYQKLGCVLI